jgi:hypothetical protein
MNRFRVLSFALCRRGECRRGRDHDAARPARRSQPRATWRGDAADDRGAIPQRREPQSATCARGQRGERGARLDVKNKRGWTPLTIAEGVEYTPDIFKRYPETAAAIRQMMSARADDPRGQARQSP